MSWCQHHKMVSTARRDFCPECNYEYYYGDAHAQGEAQISKCVNPGRDASANGVQERESFLTYGQIWAEEDEAYRRQMESEQRAQEERDWY